MFKISYGLLPYTFSFYPVFFFSIVFEIKFYLFLHTVLKSQLEVKCMTSYYYMFIRYQVCYMKIRQNSQPYNVTFWYDLLRN